LTLDTIDSALLLACILMEAVLLFFLVRGRIYQTLPVFTCYMGWNVCIDISTGIVMSLWPDRFLGYYLMQLTIDTIFQFRILAELARSVRRYNRVTSKRRIILVLLFLLAAALIWQMAVWTAPANCTIMGKILVHMLQTAAILRAAFVLALVCWSTLQGMHWPDRELRVITGFGLFALVDLGVAIVHTHQAVGPMYDLLDQVVPASYMCSLLYWIYSFAPSESKPRNPLFTNESS
jgi:hypothetical protein